MNADASRTHVDNATISDFGAQWTRFVDNEGYHGSVELLADHIEPLLTLDALRGKTVAEIGSGTGRIVLMPAGAGVARAHAIEPSDCYRILLQNTRHRADIISCQNVRGQDFEGENLDYVFAIGVLHHVTDPRPIVRRAYEALKPGGEMYVWLYGREGNELYLAFVQPFRAITRRLPDAVLLGVCHGLGVLLTGYIGLCRFLPLPMRRYMVDYLGKLESRRRLQTIFDQLNPAYAKYYTRDEACALLAECGFSNVRAHHRHGYSWSVIGRKAD
jgi:SAM-dependent methyltransferase